MLTRLSQAPTIRTLVLVSQRTSTERRSNIYHGLDMNCTRRMVVLLAATTVATTAGAQSTQEPVTASGAPCVTIVTKVRKTSSPGYFERDIEMTNKCSMTYTYNVCMLEPRRSCGEYKARASTMTRYNIFTIKDDDSAFEVESEYRP